MTSKIPRVVNLPPEMKTGQKTEANAKDQKENIPRKSVVPKMVKGVPTRYGQQAELKEQNQNLRLALTEAQQRVSELEQQNSSLEKEVIEVHRHLKDCHALLVTAKIDPVFGEAIQQNEEQRKEVMTFSTELLTELRTFNETASEQHGRLQEIQSTLSKLTKAKEQMRQEREKFSLEAADLEKALNEAEALLL